MSWLTNIRKKIGNGKIAELGIWIVIAVIIVTGTIAKEIILEYWKDTGHSTYQLRGNAERDIKVHEILAEIRSKLRADRSYIYLIHNGEQWNGGLFMNKISMAYESTSPGVSREINNLQNILITNVPQAIKEISETETSLYFVVEDQKGGKWKDMMLSQGVYAIAKAPLYKADQLIGFIGVDFNEDPEIEIDLSILDKATKRIEYLLRQ